MVLDILIYAHDGRGLGHASRSIAIGMALRRLFPNLRVLFVSGCRQSKEMIGSAPLDWLKLPSYETIVENGKSRGIIGKSMFADSQIGEFRTKELEHLVALYRPRLVLVDHTPQGKHRELVPALSISRDIETLWVLGVRGVLGAVDQARSELAVDLFRKYYQGLLWYGDSRVLGESHLKQLRELYGQMPLECGYVSRFAEFIALKSGWLERGAQFAGTVSVPWLGEKSLDFLRQLAKALEIIPENMGNWRLFIDAGDSAEIKKKVWSLFAGLHHCCLEQPGERYGDALLRSKTAVIYGGYNSLMDIMQTGIPALVIEREMRDDEQRLHLQRLFAISGSRIISLPESGATVEQIHTMLLDNLQKKGSQYAAVNLDGAEQAAKVINRLLCESA